MAKLQISEDIKKQIIELHLEGMSSSKISEMLDVKINDSTIRKYLRKLGYSGIYKKTYMYSYSYEQCVEIAQLYVEDKWDEIYSKYPDINKNRIHTISSKLKIKKESFHWSKEDIDFLIQNYGQYPIKYFEEHYNYKYTNSAIRTKAIRLGLTKSRDWSEEEHRIFIDNYSTMPIDELLKLLPDRTYNSLITRAKKYGLKSYNYLNEKYSDEQDQFIIDNWKSMSDEQIANVLGKTTCGIRDQRAKLNLYKINREYAKYENLAKLFRGHIQDWKTATMQNCDYKCILTDSKDYAIHHLYGFNQILGEAFDAIKEEMELISDNPEDYTKEQLDRMIEIFRNIHKKYPLGVCVRKDIHELFHRIYGSGGNTPEQWDRFVDDYKNGKITI